MARADIHNLACQTHALMESIMKKFAFAALAIMGIVFGTASMVVPAHASTVSLFPPSEGNG
jgi:hypothetical protein